MNRKKRSYELKWTKEFWALPPVVNKEARVDQRTTGWNTMYSFSGKERDEESGYSYFGARYYNAVKKATGSEVLKGMWGNMTKAQKAYQILFAINYSRSMGEYNFDFQDYAYGFQNHSGENISNFTISNGKGENISISNISVGCTWDNTKMTNSLNHQQNIVDMLDIYWTVNIFNGHAGSRSMIMFTVPSSYSNLFDELIIPRR
jgi:hypothetical protein